MATDNSQYTVLVVDGGLTSIIISTKMVDENP